MKRKTFQYDKKTGHYQRGKVDIPTLADMSASDPRHSPSRNQTCKI